MPNRKGRQFSWLLQALEDSTEASHSLFNPMQKKLYRLKLPETQGKLFKESSRSWVTTVKDKHSTSPIDIYLINPVARIWIKLPSKNKFPYVRKYCADKLDQEYALFLDYDFYQFCDSHHVNLCYTKKVVIVSNDFYGNF